MLEYLHAFNQGLINILPFFTDHGTGTFLYMMFGMAIGFAVGILPVLAVQPRWRSCCPSSTTWTRRRRLPFSWAPTPSPPRPVISLRSCLEFPAKASAPRRLLTDTRWRKTAKPAARSARL